MLKRWIAMPVLLLVCTGSVWAAQCPPLLEGSLPKLRAKESIDLCQRFAAKPLLIVNTASFCGFAPQFKGLEALHQRFKGQGLELIGVPSNDFKQEAKDGEETAKVCYPQHVRGPDAVHLFKVLAEQSSAPKWNFYKYVVDRKGNVIANFSSLSKPDSPELIEAIEKAIASTP